ncbi:MAG: hypothetical protein C5S44_00445, partial [Candidatus Methanocomedens sp.]
PIDETYSRAIFPEKRYWPICFDAKMVVSLWNING